MRYFQSTVFRCVMKKFVQSCVENVNFSKINKILFENLFVAISIASDDVITLVILLCDNVSIKLMIIV